MKGKFIVFEGIDGSGKSTQCKLFCERLKDKEHNVWETFEPTRGNIGNLIRERLNAGAKLPGDYEGLIYGLLFYADRIEHNFGIKKELQKGKIVVSDRYYHSTLAYQQTQGLDIDILLNLHDSLQKNGYARKPDAVFFIDVPAEDAIKRIDERVKEKTKVEIFEHMEFLKKLRENYIKLKEILDENIVVIDGTGAIEKVQERVWKSFQV